MRRLTRSLASSPSLSRLKQGTQRPKPVFSSCHDLSVFQAGVGTVGTHQEGAPGLRDLERMLRQMPFRPVPRGPCRGLSFPIWQGLLVLVLLVTSDTMYKQATQQATWVPSC